MLSSLKHQLWDEAVATTTHT